MTSDTEEGSSPVWLITGASSGLGRALTVAALASSARVVATARNPSDLDDLEEEWGSSLTTLRLDVTDEAESAAVVDAVLGRFGRIDVLVNNAGRAQIGGIEETSDAELRSLFDLHVFAPMTMSRLVLPAMRRQRSGLIVQMSSMGSLLIKPGFGAYSATKAALDALSATLAAEVAPFGIGVLIVQPGSHRTRVFSPSSRHTVRPMAEYDAVLSEVRRFVDGADGDQPGDPDRAAEVIVRVAASPRRPLRLPLGADAVRLIADSLSRMTDELAEWAPVGAATARTDSPGTEEIAARHSSTLAEARRIEPSS